MITRHRRSALLGVAVLVAVAGVVAGLALLRSGDGWSTTSATAREEFLAGERDQARMYHPEAAAHFEASLRADPDFLMPKLYLLRQRHAVPGGPERIHRLLQDLREADLSTLRPREELLARYYLAHVEHDPERADALLDAYLEDHPEDPYAVDLRCGRLWAAGDWQDSEDCYHALTRLDPNRVEAQNRIGYIRMARGEFADAAAQFQIYRFLAPDQANPHDSMAELHMVTGRYDEAAAELERALELKPDFCVSWENRVFLELLRGDFAAAGRVREEALRRGGCPHDDPDLSSCRVELWRRAAAREWGEAWEAAQGCGEWPPDFPVALLAAAGAGRRDALAEMERRLDAEVAEMASDKGPGLEEPPPLRRFLDAVVAWSDDRPDDAAAQARATDDDLLFWTGQWPLKLLARALAAEALHRAGREEEAAELEADLRGVNPRLADDPPFPLPPPG